MYDKNGSRTTHPLPPLSLELLNEDVLDCFTCVCGNWWRLPAVAGRPPRRSHTRPKPLI